MEDDLPDVLWLAKEPWMGLLVREIPGRGTKYIKESKMEYPIHVYDFVPEFVEAFKKQLEADEKRWGDTFLHRTRAGQEERTIHNYNDKFDKFLHGGEPIPWLKIIGDAYINWVREEHPEIWPE